MTGNTPIGALPVIVLPAANYSAIEMQNQGAAICLTWGTQPPSPPVMDPFTHLGVCTVGMLLLPQGSYRSHPSIIPNTALLAVSSGNANLWWQVQ